MRRRRLRTGTAVKLCLGLFAVGALLCGAAAHNHIAGFFEHSGATEIKSPPGKAPRPYGPSINWGGARE